MEAVGLPMKSFKEKLMLCKMITFMKYSTNVNRITCKVSCIWQNIAFHRNIKKKKKRDFSPLGKKSETN